MELNDFIKAFAAEFDETPVEVFAPDTKYKDLEEWGSLTALAIISMIDERFEKRVTGADIRNCETIKNLFDIVNNR